MRKGHHKKKQAIEDQSPERENKMLLNLKQASKKLKIPVSTLRNYIKESGIQIIHYGDTLRVELKDLEKLIKDRKAQTKRNARKMF